MKYFHLKYFKWFLIGCFVISFITGAYQSAENNISSIGWLILAAVCVGSFTKILIEESKNKT